MMHPLLRPITVLLLLACSLFAQQAEIAEVPGDRNAWIVSVSIPEQLGNPVKILSGTDIMETILSKRSVGESVKIPTDGILRMVKEKPNPDDAEKSLFETLAEARIPDAVRNALVILIPTEIKEGSTLLFETRIVDLADFMGGNVLFLNVSPRVILVELGAEKIELGEGEMKVTKAARPEQAENRTVSYSFKDPLNGTWSTLGTSTVVIQPNRREICFFGWNNDMVEYHGLTFPVAN